MHNHTVLRRFIYFSNDDSALFSVGLVEISQLLERVIADDVGIEYEEGRVVLAKNLLCEFERTGGTKRF